MTRPGGPGRMAPRSDRGEKSVAKQKKGGDRDSQNRLALGLALGLLGGTLVHQAALGLMVGLLLGSLPWGRPRDAA